MFIYTRRRLTCPVHGIQAEWLPWAEGKGPLMNAFKIYLAQWVKLIPIDTAAKLFHVSWQNVFADRRRLLYVGQDRTVKTLLRFFRHFGKDRSQWLKAVCCDMGWRKA